MSKLEQYENELQQLLANGYNPVTHGSVAVIVKKTDEDSYLVLQRSAEDEDGANLFDLAGGSIDEGQMPIDAALRELEEEAGLSTEHLEFVVAEKYVCPWNNEDKYCFIFKHETTEDATLSFEHQAIHWIAPEELENYEFYKGNVKNVFERVIQTSTQEESVEEMIDISEMVLA
jgi:mutator protein MutT